ncbi:MAG: tRNA pseudouridine(38-40) synthase TruA [Thermoguttaceae bacterium]|jgi:tRNA pseudouridine38-40 synthase|nr:tRNA pseudouridine(38-40) synthase TruA [Thermoguttaceae bacterium]
MRTLKLTLAYDGTDYAGWQVQGPGRVAVQEVLEQAIEAVTGARVRVLASGRTDAGVHALGQVVSFRTESRLSPETLVRALNAHLPHDVAVLDAAEVPDGFHATHSAVRKRYRYAIHNHPIRDVFRRRTSWHYPVPLDAAAMHRAAQALRGTHDFRSFQTSGSERKTTVRTVYDIEVRRGEGDEHRMIFVEIEADGFLYNMVRAIVGTLVQVGRGQRGESWPAEVLAAKDRRRAGRTAPPEGLVLLWVRYE